MLEEYQDVYEDIARWKKTRSIPLAYEICYKISHMGEEKEVETDDLIGNVMAWGREHKLNDPKAQLNKVIEEVGEMAHEICRNRYDSGMMVDAIGDTMVTIIILSDILGYDPIYCLGVAYDTIKNRKGHTDKGTFVKEQNGED